MKEKERDNLWVYRPMTVEQRAEEYQKGEMNAWKHSALDRRLKVGL